MARNLSAPRETPGLGNYLDVLGLDLSATSEDIEEAYQATSANLREKAEAGDYRSGRILDDLEEWHSIITQAGGYERHRRFVAHRFYSFANPPIEVIQSQVRERRYQHNNS